MVNLMTIDANQLVELVFCLNNSWLLVMLSIFCLIYLWFKLGTAALAGVVILVLMMPFNSVMASKNKKMQVVKQRFQDQRIKILNDILNGIKV